MEAIMEKEDLRNNLTMLLGKLYDIEAFSHLADFLQGELHVLNYLSQNINIEINPSMLSDHLYVSRSRVTATLATLRKKGYIRMQISEEDRRKMRVILTAEGKRFIKEKQKNVERYFDQLVEGLGEQDTMDLMRLIKKSIRVMNNKEETI